jgi:hypothetical protein
MVLITLGFRQREDWICFASCLRGRIGPVLMSIVGVVRISLMFRAPANALSSIPSAAPV